MSDYDFKSLSPSDFEELCRDLLERHLAVKLKSFTNGPDGGIDLRHAPVLTQINSIPANDLIVQCKHYARSSFSQLKSAIKNELPKIQELQPDRYVVATSIGLSPSNVDEILKLLHPFCKSQDDLLGANDINNLLKDNPDIEQKHPKLWVTSEGVLQRVLHNKNFMQSAMARDEIRHRLSLYVYTERFQEASEALNKDHVVVIAGPPGAGKTTLAEMLILDYLAKGWGFVKIRGDVSEGLDVFRDDKTKQVFYYDDFLGQVSSREKLTKNEDGSIVGLIKAIEGYKNKRFILTTREYILAQAQIEHEKLAKPEVNVLRFVIKCEDYDTKAKARILVNHLYFNGVSKHHIKNIVKGHGYNQIIHHNNYSPRIVESMTKAFNVKECLPSKYLALFVSKLDNPEELWKPSFEEHISEASRHLILTLATCGAVFIEDLETAFESFYRSRCQSFGWRYHPSDFRKSLGELEGDFIRIDSHDGRKFVQFSNPSLLDYVSYRLANEPHEVEDLLKNCVAFEQIDRLANTLSILKPRDKSDDPPFRNDDLVTNAVKGCFHSNSIILKKNIWGGSWSRTNVNRWNRLSICLTLCESPASKNLRNLVSELADECFSNLSDYGFFEDVLNLVDNFENTPWIRQELKTKWKKACKEYLFGREGYSGDDFEELHTTMMWIESQRSFEFITDEEFSEQKKLIQEAVEEFAENKIEDCGIDEEWQELQSETQKFVDDFTLSLDDCLSRINLAWDEWTRPEEPDDDDVAATHLEDDKGVTIDSLFDSLLG